MDVIFYESLSFVPGEGGRSHYDSQLWTSVITHYSFSHKTTWFAQNQRSRTKNGSFGANICLTKRWLWPETSLSWKCTMTVIRAVKVTNGQLAALFISALYLFVKLFCGNIIIRKIVLIYKKILIRALFANPCWQNAYNKRLVNSLKSLSVRMWPFIFMIQHIISTMIYPMIRKCFHVFYKVKFIVSHRRQSNEQNIVTKFFSEFIHQSFIEHRWLLTFSWHHRHYYYVYDDR